MDINDLDSFSHKKQKTNSIKDSKEPKVIIEEKEESSKMDSSEFKSYGSIEITVSNPQTQKPIVDIYLLSKNCSEYIILNELFLKKELMITELETVIELEKRNYIKRIFDFFKNNSKGKWIEFETDSFVFKDYLFMDYPNYFSFSDEETLYINIFNTKLNSCGIQLDNLITDESISGKKFIISKIINNTYYNFNYCNRCLFNKNCTRRKLIT